MSAEFAIDLLTALWLGFTGACIGSFLNVVAYRLPRGMSVVWKPSHCPHCSHPIRARDNVPVLGWLLLSGKCRDCGGPISPRYAIVEAVMGAAFFVLAYVELFSGGANLPEGPITELTGAGDIVWNLRWPLIGAYVYHCAGLSTLCACALIDWDQVRLPWRLILISVLIAIIPPVLNPQMQGQQSWSLTRQFGLMLGVMIMAMFLGGLFTGLTQQTPHKLFNLVATLTIAGLFVAPSEVAVVSFFALYIVVSLLTFVVKNDGPYRDRTFVPETWLTFFLHVMFCNQLSELFPHL